MNEKKWVEKERECYNSSLRDRNRDGNREGEKRHRFVVKRINWNDTSRGTK